MRNNRSVFVEIVCVSFVFSLLISGCAEDQVSSNDASVVGEKMEEGFGEMVPLNAVPKRELVPFAELEASVFHRPDIGTGRDATESSAAIDTFGAAAAAMNAVPTHQDPNGSRAAAIAPCALAKFFDSPILTGRPWATRLARIVPASAKTVSTSCGTIKKWVVMPYYDFAPSRITPTQTKDAWRKLYDARMNPALIDTKRYPFLNGLDWQSRNPVTPGFAYVDELKRKYIAKSRYEYYTKYYLDIVLSKRSFNHTVGYVFYGLDQNDRALVEIKLKTTVNKLAKDQNKATISGRTGQKKLGELILSNPDFAKGPAESKKTARFFGEIRADLLTLFGAATQDLKNAPVQQWQTSDFINHDTIGSLATMGISFGILANEVATSGGLVAALRAAAWYANPAVGAAIALGIAYWTLWDKSQDLVDKEAAKEHEAKQDTRIDALERKVNGDTCTPGTWCMDKKMICKATPGNGRGADVTYSTAPSNKNGPRTCVAALEAAMAKRKPPNGGINNEVITIINEPQGGSPRNPAGYLGRCTLSFEYVMSKVVTIVNGKEQVKYVCQL